MSEEQAEAVGAVALAHASLEARRAELQSAVDRARTLPEPVPWNTIGRALGGLQPDAARHRHGGGPEGVQARRDAERERKRAAARARLAA